MNNILIWLWAGAALLFFIAELFTAGFFLVCFGIGAVAAALLAAFNVDILWQFVAFIGVSGLAVVFVRPFANQVSSHTDNPVGIDRVVGKPAVVLEEINPLLASGQVRVEREEWRADSVDGQPIAKDEIVEVVAVSGTRLLVKKSQASTPPLL
jgi:membrane protein implicated in regulation of membrane protease activity